MRLFEPPDGDADLAGDADLYAGLPGHPYKALEVAEVGVVQARRPLPNAVPVLSAAVNGKLPNQTRLAHLTRFILNHLSEGEYERLLGLMMDGDAPPDTMERVAAAIAEWGTARPTGPSGSSRP